MQGHPKFMSTAHEVAMNTRESSVRAREDAVHSRENAMMLREHAMCARELALVSQDHKPPACGNKNKPGPHDAVWVGNCPGEEWTNAPWLGTETWYRNPVTEKYYATAYLQYGDGSWS